MQRLDKNFETKEIKETTNDELHGKMGSFVPVGEPSYQISMDPEWIVWRTTKANESEQTVNLNSEYSEPQKNMDISNGGKGAAY